MHTHILSTMFLGLVIGALPKLFDTENRGGFAIPMCLGLLGSLGAGLVGRATGWYGFAEGPGVLVSLAAALVFTLLYRRALSAVARLRLGLGGRFQSTLMNQHRVDLGSEDKYRR